MTATLQANNELIRTEQLNKQMLQQQVILLEQQRTQLEQQRRTEHVKRCLAGKDQPMTRIGQPKFYAMGRTPTKKIPAQGPVGAKGETEKQLEEKDAKIAALTAQMEIKRNEKAKEKKKDW